MKTALLSLLLGVTACGYNAGLRLPVADGSVGVEIFGNESLERDIEVELARFLTRSVSDLVHAPLVSPKDADVVIRGTILDYHFRDGVRSGTGRVLTSGEVIGPNELLETSVRIDVNASLVERSSGKVLAHIEGGIWSGFVVGNQRNEVTARNRAFENIAERLVLDLLSGAHPGADG